MIVWLFNYNLPSTEKIMNPEAIPIQHPSTEPPLEVAIGLDPSSRKTGLTLGRVDMEYPILGLLFEREEHEDISVFLHKKISYIAEKLIAYNNLSLRWIFTENKYEGQKAQNYSIHTREVLSAVKIAVKGLPARIKDISIINHKAEFDYMMPSEWRKLYLGNRNTNAKRKEIKQIVLNETMIRYNLDLHYMIYDDLLESLAIYSAGFKKNIEPTLKNGNYAAGDFNSIDWSHKVEVQKFISLDIKEDLNRLFSTEPIKERISKFGLKTFDYKRGESLERNMRSLTTKSNAVFVVTFPTWDLEAIPIYYELKTIPRTNKEKLVVVFFRKNIIN